MATPKRDDPVSIPVVYIGVEDAPILYSNQFAVQVEGNDFIVTAGQLTPPILVGSEEEQREQAKQLSYVPIRVVARLAINRERAAQLAALLGKQLQQYDERQTEQD